MRPRKDEDEPFRARLYSSPPNIPRGTVSEYVKRIEQNFLSHNFD